MTINFDRVDFVWLYRETVRVLEMYRGRVREGKDIEAAIVFCNYVRFSGIPKLCKLAGRGEGALDCNGEALEGIVRECGYLAHEVVRSDGKAIAGPEISEVEKLNSKLQVVADKLERLELRQGRAKRALSCSY